ncbi:MAG: FAD-dependent oxidoreductase [Microbacterium sp.]
MAGAVTTGRTVTDTDVAVVGGGVAGLVVARDLAAAGVRVVVCEASDTVGGLLRRGIVAGLDVDLGAESFATRTDAVAQLAAELDLPTQAPRPGGARLVVATRGGTLRVPLPRRTILGIPADPLAADVVAIIGADAAALAAREGELPAHGDRGGDLGHGDLGHGDPGPSAFGSGDLGPVDIGPEPSLHDLVARRLGPLVAARLVDPLCRSVYSRPAAQLRLSRVNPALWRAFVAQGSLVRAVAALVPASSGQDSPRAGAAVAGIVGGMWRLPQALAASASAFGADLRTSTAVTAVTAVTETEDGFLVHTPGGTTRARRVVVAAGPGAAASLLGTSSIASGSVSGSVSGGDFPSEGPDAADSSSRGEISSLTAGGGIRIAIAAIDHPGLDVFPVGSGVIVDPALETAAKALTHVTAKWEWARAAARGLHLVRLSARDPQGAGLETAADVAREVALLTGVDLRPDNVVDVVVQDWRDAVNDASAADAEDAGDAQAARFAEDADRGILHTGAAAAGTGLASVVPHARALAARLIAEFDPFGSAAPEPGLAADIVADLASSPAADCEPGPAPGSVIEPAPTPPASRPAPGHRITRSLV